MLISTSIAAKKADIIARQERAALLRRIFSKLKKLFFVPKLEVNCPTNVPEPCR